MPTPKIQTPATLLTHSQPLIDNANNLTEQAEKAVVTNAEEFATATDFVKICKSQFDQAEDARKAITGPLNDHIKWINDQFRPITSAFSAAKEKVSVKAAAWKQAEDKRVREEEEAARKAGPAYGRYRLDQDQLERRGEIRRYPGSLPGHR
jgi:hypothetical protein